MFGGNDLINQLSQLPMNNLRDFLATVPTQSDVIDRHVIATTTPSAAVSTAFVAGIGEDNESNESYESASEVSDFFRLQIYLFFIEHVFILFSLIYMFYFIFNRKN